MGRPQRSAAQASRRSARAAVPIKNEASPRSSRSKHNFSLDDPEQVERDLNAQLKLMGLYAANTTGGTATASFVLSQISFTATNTIRTIAAGDVRPSCCVAGQVCWIR